jgi:1,4-alpha-glucan branching enzyme
MGKLEVITCPATHMILPLFKHAPEMIRGEIAIACRQYEAAMGRPPRGMWLPENAYTPGIDRFLADAGIRWSLLNANGVNNGDTKAFFGTDAPVIAPAGVAFFGIDEETRASVWSREGGYPGHVNYKEWYRDLGYEAEWDYLPEYFHTANLRRNTGIKYYRITRKGGDLGSKEYYQPLWAEGTAHEQAGQFVYYRGAKANHAVRALGRKSIVTSAYDAELFGHWWEEGPMWIESVFRKLLYDQSEVRPVTPSEYLAEQPHQQRMTPGASSWGKKDYFQTWVDGRSYQPNCWVYRHMYRLSNRLVDLATRHKNNENALLERALNQAARELLLAISSDWGFLIETGQAVRYSELRITNHAARARELMRQIENDCIDPTYLCTLETADCPFAGPEMDFRLFARS